MDFPVGKISANNGIDVEIQSIFLKETFKMIIHYKFGFNDTFSFRTFEWILHRLFHPKLNAAPEDNRFSRTGFRNYL